MCYVCVGVVAVVTCFGYDVDDVDVVVVRSIVSDVGMHDVGVVVTVCDAGVGGVVGGVDAVLTCACDVVLVDGVGGAADVDLVIDGVDVCCV